MDLSAAVGRVRDRGWQIAQCSLGAGSAYLLGVRVLHHPQPVFAAVAAVVALGVSYAQRRRRVVEVVVGVALGVLIGDLLVRVAGSGAWQVALVVALGMAVAVFLGAGNLMINQSAIQGVFITVYLPAARVGLARFEDAALGGAVALVLAVLVPATPLRRPLQLAADLLGEVADLLWDAAAAARSGDAEHARAALAHARSTQVRLDALRTAASEGLEVVTLSPLRRRSATGLRSVAAMAEPLDRAVRNVRVLARRLAVLTERGEDVPGSLLDLVDALGSAAMRLGEDLGAARRTGPAVEGLAAVGAASLAVPRSTLSGDVVLAQVRSTAVDLLEVAGLDDAQARAHVPAAPPGPPAAPGA